MKKLFICLLVGVFVAPTFAIPKQTQTKIAYTIDKYVLQGLKAYKQKPMPVLDDETFIRRIYLDIAGRVPTYWEYQQFMKMPIRTRRLILSINLWIHLRT